MNDAWQICFAKNTQPKIQHGSNYHEGILVLILLDFDGLVSQDSHVVVVSSKTTPLVP